MREVTSEPQLAEKRRRPRHRSVCNAAAFAIQKVMAEFWSGDNFGDEASRRLLDRVVSIATAALQADEDADE